MWCGLAPLWVALVALLWRPRDTRWLGALASFFLTALPFVAMVAIRKGRLNDDGLGLGAAVGGCNVAGFVLGWVFHGIIRRARARSDASRRDRP